MTCDRKRNVPPFQGGTWEHFRPKAVGVNAARQGFLANVKPVRFRCGGKQVTIPGWRNMWTVGPDSCAGVTAYCSVLPVGYDISCDSSDLKSSDGLAYTSGRAFCARRGLRDSAYWDFLQIWHRSTAPFRAALN